MRAIYLLILLVALSPGALAQQTWPAASAERTDVVAAIAQAADGDTVTIPADSAAWADTITLAKAITLQGAGVGQTIITLDTSWGEDGIAVTLVANKTTRITGIEFIPGAAVEHGIAITVVGSAVDSRRIRIDHCKFNELKASAFWSNGALGVVDNNTFLVIIQLGIGYMRQQRWNDGVADSYGDGAYAAADDFGSENWLFFENNTITNTWTGGPNHLTVIDGDAGCRYVVRHNTITKCSVENHGLESGGRFRGGRAFEVYENTFIGEGTGGTILGLHRSGVALWWNNTVTGYGANANIALEHNRQGSAFSPFSLGYTERQGADGINPWDVNEAGGPFLTGTNTGTPSASGATRTITVAGGGMTPSAWVGYTINKTSGKAVSSVTRSGSTVTVTCTGHGFTTGWKISVRGCNQPEYNTTATVTVTDANTFTYSLDFGNTPATPATGTIYAFRGYSHAEITANDATTITYNVSVQTIDTGANFYDLTFSGSDTFALYKVNHGMDQVGRIGGSLISGDIPTRPVGWNDQTTSACYAWDNTREGGAPVELTSLNASIREDEHYVNGTAKPGYTPYTYPHPIIEATEGTTSEATATTINAGTVTIETN